MAEQETDQRVSAEAHQRVAQERDQFKARVAELEAVVKDIGVRDHARSFFKDAGASDPDWAAEFVIPHLRDVEIDKLPEVLSGERFKPLLGQPPAPAQSEPEIPVEQPRGFGGGPQPTGGGAPTQPQKIPGSQAKNLPPSQLAELDAKGMIDWNPEVSQFAG